MRGEDFIASSSGLRRRLRRPSPTPAAGPRPPPAAARAPAGCGSGSGGTPRRPPPPAGPEGASLRLPGPPRASSRSLPRPVTSATAEPAGPGPRREGAEVPSTLTPCPEGATRGQLAPSALWALECVLLARTRRPLPRSGRADLSGERRGGGGSAATAPSGTCACALSPSPSPPLSRSPGLRCKRAGSGVWGGSRASLCGGHRAPGTTFLLALPLSLHTPSCRRQERAPREGETEDTCPALSTPLLPSPLHQGPGWPGPAPGGM